MSTRDTVSTYISRSWAVLPVPRGEKAPKVPAWQKRDFTPEDFPEEFNIGVKLGNPSGGLVDVDIDALDALPLADQHLPPTDSIFGRESKRRSHRLYIAPSGQRTRRWTDAQGKVIVELRANGSQTIFAGSIHPSGEPVEWDSDGRPAQAMFSMLAHACESLAQAVRAQRGEPPAEQPPASPAAPDAPTGAAPPTEAPRNPAAIAELLNRARKYVGSARPSAEGGRNTQAFSIAGHIAAMREMGQRLAESQVLELLRNWNSRNNPPLSDGELAKCVASAFRNGIPRAEKPGRIETPPRPKPKLIEPFKPFPVEVLPAPFDRFVIEGARAIGCDLAFVVLPMLSAAASAIGNTRRIELKRTWTEPAVVWTAIVGDSGTLKSPALELALGAIRKRQRQAIKEHEKDMERYAIEAARYKMAMGAWEKAGGEGNPPPAPELPVLSRTWCSDTTMEALACLLQQNPRGILVVADELAGWLGSFDRYSQGKGGDAAKWLEVHGARPVFIDRKTGNPRTIYIPRAAVSIAGGIQPQTLQRALGREYFENGLAARLLLACPPRRAKHWTEAVVPAEVEQAVVKVFDRLFSLMPGTDHNGDPEPGIVRMSPRAKEVWVPFYNEHAKEHAGMTGDLSAAWSKLEGYAARLALVMHCIRWAAGDATLKYADIVDEVSVAAGVAMSNWFGHETKRVYSILDETEDDGQCRALAELVQRHGGSMTVRDLMRCSRDYPTAEAAEQALAGLVQAGWGRWESVNPTEQGGRPTSRFVLTQCVDTDTTPRNREEVEVVSTGTPEAGPDAGGAGDGAGRVDDVGAADAPADSAGGDDRGGEGDGNAGAEAHAVVAEAPDPSPADTTPVMPRESQVSSASTPKTPPLRRTLDPDRPGPTDLLTKAQYRRYRAVYDAHGGEPGEKHAAAWRVAVGGGKE